MNDYRIEKDSMGEVKVPNAVLWGAQTQRCLDNFPNTSELLPPFLIQALLMIKSACAKVNFINSKADIKKGEAICDACLQIMSSDIILENFPLKVWQTGSGTQTNMNVNEVISNYINTHSKYDVSVHPNDDVNKSQSTNDVFPTAINISVALLIIQILIPTIDKLLSSFDVLIRDNDNIIKSGRTHLQDATPIKFSQEVSAWKDSVQKDKEMLVNSLHLILMLPIGGTAVGTGINTPKDFDKNVVVEINDMTGITFVPCDNKFASLSSKSNMVYCHGAIKALACDLIKIANDIRFLACGPRTGIGEISIPANEPGSSIMPGKVNPTQCEQLIMACMQVKGNDVTISDAASAGMLELNVCMPVIAYNIIQSIEILSKSIDCFNDKLVSGIKVNEDKMKENLENSLMNATILNPIIGYDNVAKAVNYAHNENKTIKQACIELELLSAEEFDNVYDLSKMV